jgi:hypothetical protein
MREINRKIKTYRFTVAKAGDVVVVDSETDKLFKTVDGIKAIVSNDRCKIGSTMQLAINEEEIFPEDFDILNITSNEDCPVDQRFYTDNGNLSIPANGSTVKIRYKDGGNGTEGEPKSDYPYTVSIIITEKK